MVVACIPFHQCDKYSFQSDTENAENFITGEKGKTKKGQTDIMVCMC